MQWPRAERENSKKKQLPSAGLDSMRAVRAQNTNCQLCHNIKLVSWIRDAILSRLVTVHEAPGASCGIL